VVDYAEVNEALELATGKRRGEHQAADARDIEITRRHLLLFLEDLDPAMTVCELREQLDG
jgi:hypothetical protein